MSETLHLSPEYYQAVDCEVLKESINNEIARYVERVHELGFESEEAQTLIAIVNELETVQDGLRADNADSLALVSLMLDVLRKEHQVGAAA